MVKASDAVRDAVLSKDLTYRYLLSRRWSDGGRILLWVMLNPSIADGRVDDPTIRRCIAFSSAWGYDALEVVNLFAFRTSEPVRLAEEQRWGGEIVAIGPDNDEYIRAAYRRSSRVVAAWGAHPIAGPRSHKVFELFDARPSIYCLGRTKDGSPRHPLYVHGRQPLIPYVLRG